MPCAHSGRACTAHGRLTTPGRDRSHGVFALIRTARWTPTWQSWRPTRPEDVFLDVGGGAGRVALPLALRCREVTTVDASPGMGAEFTAAAAEAGISNARFVHANWLEAEGFQGDVALTSNVTYFVREIVPFITKLASAARRRVMITVWSVANPNQNAALFHLVYGEEPVGVPGYRELLPVLWELDILPDVHVLPGVPWYPVGTWEPGCRRRRRTPCSWGCRGSGWGTKTTNAHAVSSKSASPSCLRRAPRAFVLSGVRRRVRC